MKLEPEMSCEVFSEDCGSKICAIHTRAYGPRRSGFNPYKLGCLHLTETLSPQRQD